MLFYLGYVYSQAGTLDLIADMRADYDEYGPAIYITIVRDESFNKELFERLIKEQKNITEWGQEENPEDYITYKIREKN